MNESQAAKWSVTRQMGKAKYVMIRGVLLWDIILTGLFTAMEWFTQQSLQGQWITLRVLVFGFIVFFAANSRWESNERRYREASEKAMGQKGTGKPKAKK